jgi:hypothetical protein
MALFVLPGVLRGFPAAAYRRTPHRNPLCGLGQNKNCSFLNGASIVLILDFWIEDLICAGIDFWIDTNHIFVGLQNFFSPVFSFSSKKHFLFKIPQQYFAKYID